jgi:hypothetical protein
MKLVVALFALLAVTLAADEIIVLASKELSNKVVVHDREAVLKYSIYNTGAS